MKRSILAAVLVLGLSSQALALGKGQFLFTGSAAYSNCFSDSTFDDTLNNGLGAYLSLEYLALDWMSIGLGTGNTTYFNADHQANVNSLDLTGRLFPFAKTQKKDAVIPYLIGGAGYRPLWDKIKPYWGGKYHAQAGLGGRWQFKDGDEKHGIDVGFVYNLYTPLKVPLHNVELRVGYSLIFGGTKGPKAPEAPKAGKKDEKKGAAAAPTPTAGTPTVAEYTLTKTDTLWAVCCRRGNYSDCELYPLLVDANKDVLKTPADVKEGVVIKMPMNPTEDMKKDAYKKAWDKAYLPWRGAQVTKEKYDAWKANRAKTAK